MISDDIKPRRPFFECAFLGFFRFSKKKSLNFKITLLNLQYLVYNDN